MNAPAHRRPLASHKLCWAVLATALLTSACGRHRVVTQVPQTPPQTARTSPAAAATASAPSEAAPGTTEVGYASWYGDPYHGRRGADGEIYDKNQMTAAHRTLPFDTMVKVTNLENELTTTVRITDRGPFVDGRIIDLSLAAAREIQMIGPGTALVRLEVLARGQQALSARYAVQVGALTEEAAALLLMHDMALRYGNAFIENYQSDSGPVFRVRVGPYSSEAEGQQLKQQMESDGVPGFVVRLDN
jgi:rare lipoprotein A